MPPKYINIPIESFKFEDLVIDVLNTQFVQAYAPIYCQAKIPAIETQPIQITNYGIPRIHVYCPEDKYRRFIMIPFDANQPSCMQLKTLLEKADEYFSSDNMKKALFGTKWDRYAYTSIIRDKNSG